LLRGDDAVLADESGLPFPWRTQYIAQTLPQVEGSGSRSRAEDSRAEAAKAPITGERRVVSTPFCATAPSRKIDDMSVPILALRV